MKNEAQAAGVTAYEAPSSPVAPAPGTIQPQVIRKEVIVQKQDVSDALLAAFTAIGYVVSARAILLVDLIGGFVLGLMAMSRQTPMSLGILVAYFMLTTLPMIWLEVNAKRPVVSSPEPKKE